MSEPDFRDGRAGRLPEGPPPDAEARERAIGAALARFDAREGEATGKGFPIGRRRRDRDASRRTSVMVSTRKALAAAAVVAVAAPLAWRLAREQGTEPTASPPVTAPAPKQADAPAALPYAPAPERQAAEAERARSVAQAESQAAQVRARTDSEKMAALAAQSEGSAPATRSLARPAPPAAVYERRSYYAPGAAPAGAAPEAPAVPAEPIGRDRFDGKPQSGFKAVREVPVSTFSIDVDTAAYGYLRASLNRDVLPPPDAVRTEELVNYFPYGYPAPESPDEPFRVSASVFPSPWAEGRKIVRIGIKGYEIRAEARPKANLVFLVDTSGSMSGPNRLPLVKRSLALLLTKLDANDKVAIVAYAGEAGTVLEPTPASEKQKILSAIEGLGAGGATAGGEGLRQAYALAERNYDKQAVNRVMLATDGDFNVGIANQDELKGFVERKRESGIFLSVLGFGMGNYNDGLMQALAQNGNGTAATIDTLAEARKVLVEEATATLFPIAKDVKIQVEFNPATVSEYRLIGYETRALAREDFENDKVDAGEVGSGQTATALYEIVPAGGPRTLAPLRYGEAEGERKAAGKTGEYAFVKIRYKRPDAAESRLIETPVGPAVETGSFAQADADARFATAVAGFGEILRGGRWTGRFGLDDVIAVASAARGEDPFGYRNAFVQLVRAAKTAQALRAQKP